MQFLTDTHALIWHFTDSPRITRKAREVFDRCERGGCVVFIPTIVVAECPSLFEKKRVSFDFKALLAQIRDSANYVIVPFDYKVLAQMVETPEVEELHDKIIVATTKVLGVPVITKDSHLRGLRTVTTLW